MIHCRAGEDNDPLVAHRRCYQVVWEAQLPRVTLIHLHSFTDYITDCAQISVIIFRMALPGLHSYAPYMQMKMLHHSVGLLCSRKIQIFENRFGR